MNRDAMEPFGRALLAYFEGDVDAELMMQWDDGHEAPLPMSHFFRQQPFSPIEEKALSLCTGLVLDAGAGSGLHSLVLQSRGMSVTAIDISPLAVDVMRRRGVADVRCVDIFSFKGRGYDTLLMMDHGIGLVETMEGLDLFLARVPDILSEGGQVLLDSLDLRRTRLSAQNQAYFDRNKRAGRYIGEIRMRFSFKNKMGPYCGFLHVDADSLAERARLAGLDCQIALQEADGNYLAVLRSPM